MLVYIIPPLFSPGRPLRKNDGPACRLPPRPYDSARGFRHVKRIKILSPETVCRKPPEGKKGTRFPSVTPGFRPTGRGNFTGSRTDCKPRANNGLFWVKRGFRGVRVPPSASSASFLGSVGAGGLFFFDG